MEKDLLMSLLPEEILIDIASRLSAKDACRLKCSSKAWLFLISSSSDFMKLHRRRAPQRSPLLVLASSVDDQWSVRDFSPPKLNCKVNLLLLSDCHNQHAESCRDLMCFRSILFTYVYNPLTMEYLRFYTNDTTAANFLVNYCMVGLVYIDSLRLYKLVKLELYSCTSTARFESVTLVEDEKDGRVGRVSVDDDNEFNEWELICQHTLPLQSRYEGLGNLIGVNGVVYSIAYACNLYHAEVVSLSFEDDKEQQLKIFNLPRVIVRCGKLPRGLTLSRVKDVLCVPHESDSTIDLWLLEDRNSGLWSKGYSISYIPPVYGSIGQVVYLPHPKTIDNDDDDDADVGLFLFTYNLHLYQYDIRTKVGVKLLPNTFLGNLHSYPDNLVSLKDAARCPLIPRLWHDLNSSELKEKITTTTPLYSTWFPTQSELL